MSFEQANQCSATVEIFNNQCSMFNFLGLLGKREVVYRRNHIPEHWLLKIVN
jgi:hypothetical protein